MNKEELKNQIRILLKDIFSFGFYYDEETNQFISCDYYDDYDYTDIYVNEDGIILGIDIDRGWTGFISFNQMIKLNELIKEFYK